MKKRKPWEIPDTPWKTEAAFMSYVRGGVRKSIWSRYPVKTSFMKANRIRQVNKRTGKMCYGFKCAACKEFHPQSNIEIDHLSGHNQFKTLDDASSYLKAILYVDYTDLQAMCKDCHRIKSYAERMNIPFEEARLEKAVIAYMKKSNTVIDKTLAKHGLPCNNAKVRKDGVRKLMKEGKL
jgi:glutaredoxin